MRTSVPAALSCILLFTAPVGTRARAAPPISATEAATWSRTQPAPTSARRAPQPPCSWEKVKKILCATIGKPVCMIISFVKKVKILIQLIKKHGFSGALKELWKRFKARLKKEADRVKTTLKEIFDEFRQVLLMKKWSMKPILGFTKNAVKKIQKLAKRFFKKAIGLPSPLDKVLGWIVAGPLYPMILAATTPIATVAFGFRSLMKWVIPKLILGGGKAFDAAQHSKAGKLFAKIATGIIKLVKGGGGLIFKLFKDPAMQEKIRGVFLDVADVAGKVRHGVEGALKVAEQIRTGTFEDIDKALQSTATVPSKLSKQELTKVVDGLLELGKQQLWLMLSPKLRKVLTEALKGLTKLLEVPRNALVAAIGDVPLVGGVLAAGLNFGLGWAIDKLVSFLVDNVMKMVETLVNDSWKDIKEHIVTRLVRSEKSRQRTGQFIELVKGIGKLAGDLSDALTTASKGVQGTIGTLVATALEKFILRGVQNPQLRQVLSAAVGAVVQGMSKPSFNLRSAVVDVLKRVGPPLSALVANKIANPRLKGIVQNGLQALLGALANPAGVSSVMKNPLGFLAELGYRLVGKLKTELAGFILGRIKNPQLAQVVGAAIGAIGEMVKQRGFSALLRFKELLGKLYSALKKPLLALLLGKVKSPRLRQILEGGITFVAAELEAKGVGGLLQGGLVSFFVRLFERIQEPLVDLLVQGVGSEPLRAGIKQAIATVIAKAKQGKVGQLLDFKKVLVDVIRLVGPILSSLVAKQISDRRLQGIVSKGLQTLLGGLANEAALDRILKNPLGFLTEVAVRLVGNLNRELAGFMLGRIQNPRLQQVVAAAIGTLATTVEQEGFGALLQFRKLLGKLYAALKQPLLGLLLDKISNRRLRAVVEDGLAFVTTEIQARGIAGALQGGISGLLRRLFERIADPLVDMLLRDVDSQALRDGAKKAVATVLAKIRSGGLPEPWNFKKVLGSMVRLLTPAVAGFVEGKVQDASFRAEVTKVIGPEINRVAGMIEQGSFQGIGEVLASAAQPVLQVLKTRLVGRLPGELRTILGKALDNMVPLLQKAAGRAKLLQEGPKMLWAHVVAYLEGLYAKIQKSVGGKAAQVQAAISRVLDGLRGGLGNIAGVIHDLASLAQLLRGVRLPSLAEVLRSAGLAAGRGPSPRAPPAGLSFGGGARRRALAPCFSKGLKKGLRRFGRTIKRTAKRVGRAVNKAVQQARTAIKKAAQWAKKTLKKAATWVKEKAKKVIDKAKQIARKAGRIISSAAAKAKKAWKKASEAIGKGLKTVGELIKKEWKVLCLTVVGTWVCAIMAVVKGLQTFIPLVRKHGFGGALKELWKRFKNKVKKELKIAKGTIKDIFQKFRELLLMDKLQIKRIAGFTKDATKKIQKMVSGLLKRLGLPSIFSTVVGWIVAGPLYPAIFSVSAPLATISYGFRKLMKWLLPKIILGAGKVWGGIAKGEGSKLFEKISQGILKAIRIGGGLLMSFIKNPKTKDRIKRLFERVADVSGKIQRGIAGTLKVAEKIRTGTFSDVETALKSTVTLPSKLTAEDTKKIVAGLLDFGKDQIWAKLNPVLRNLLTEALSLLDRVIDIPRNAMVLAIGEIPFVGGIIASAVNFAAGILVDQVKGILIDGVVKIAQTLVNDLWSDIREAVVARLTRSKRATERTGKFIELVKVVGEAAGGLAKSLTAASKGLQGSISALVSTALDKFLLRGVRNPQVRKIISEAVGAVIAQFTKPAFNLTDAVVAVLRKIGPPLSALVAKPIENPRLRGIVQKGLATLLAGLASPGGVRAVMANPLGFLTDLGVRLVGKLKDELAALILGRVRNPKLRQVVAAAIGALAETVKRGGFSALLQFRKLLGNLYTALKKPVLELLLSKVRNPRLRAILENGLSFVAAELESKGLSGIMEGGILSFFVKLFERIQDPLVDLLLKGVRSPLLRTAVKKGLALVLAKAKQGSVGDLLDIKKVLAQVIGVLGPTVSSLVAKQIKNPTLRTLVDQGLRTLLGSLGSEAGVDRLLADPLGFLTGLAVQLVTKLKDPLAKLLLGKVRNPKLREALVAGIGALVGYIHEKGFSALLNFKDLLSALITALKKPLLSMLLGKVTDPRLRQALENGLAFVIAEVQAKGIGGIIQEGILSFIARVFERIKDPLLDRLLAKIGSPLLRDGARVAIDAIVAGVKTGDFTEALRTAIGSAIDMASKRVSGDLKKGDLTGTMGTLVTVLAAGGVLMKAVDGVSAAMGPVRTAAAGVGEALGKAGEWLKDAVTEAGRKLTSLGQKVLDGLKTVGKGIAKGILRGPFWAYIEGHRIPPWTNGARHLTAKEKQYLKRFFPARLVDKVRLSVNPTWTGFFNFHAGATTYGEDFIIIRKHFSEAERLNLLKHEMVHACQYERYGVQGFAFLYADQFVDSGFSYVDIKFEDQAYRFAGREGVYPGMNQPVDRLLGYCQGGGAPAGQGATAAAQPGAAPQPRGGDLFAGAAQAAQGAGEAARRQSAQNMFAGAAQAAQGAGEAARRQSAQNMFAGAAQAAQRGSTAARVAAAGNAAANWAADAARRIATARAAASVAQRALAAAQAAGKATAERNRLLCEGTCINAQVACYNKATAEAASDRAYGLMAKYCMEDLSDCRDRCHGRSPPSRTGRVVFRTLSAAEVQAREIARTINNAPTMDKKAGALEWVRDQLGKAKTAVNSAVNFGLDYVVKHAKEAWEGLKSLDCGKVIGAIGSFDPITVGLGRLWGPLRTCVNKIREGFWCSLPDFVKDVGSVIVGSARAAWEHKGACIGGALASIPMTGPVALSIPMACGFAHWAAAKVRKVYACFEKLKAEKIFMMLLEEALKQGCSIVGGLIFDAVMAALTGGAGTVAKVAQWVEKVFKAISPAERLRIASTFRQKSVDSLVDLTKNAAKRYHECK